MEAWPQTGSSPALLWDLSILSHSTVCSKFCGHWIIILLTVLNNFWKQIIFINSVTHVYISLTWREYNPKPQNHVMHIIRFRTAKENITRLRWKACIIALVFFIVRHLSVMKYITLRQWLQLICKEQYMWQI